MDLGALANISDCIECSDGTAPSVRQRTDVGSRRPYYPLQSEMTTECTLSRLCGRLTNAERLQQRLTS